MKYNRNFKTPEEEAERKAIFVDTLLRIEKHNSEGHSWTMGVNQFADMVLIEEKAYLRTLTWTFTNDFRTRQSVKSSAAEVYLRDRWMKMKLQAKINFAISKKIMFSEFFSL